MVGTPHGVHLVGGPSSSTQSVPAGRWEDWTSVEARQYFQKFGQVVECEGSEEGMGGWVVGWLRLSALSL